MEPLLHEYKQTADLPKVVYTFTHGTEKNLPSFVCIFVLLLYIPVNSYGH